MNAQDFQQYSSMLEVLKTLRPNDLDILGRIIQMLNNRLAQLQEPEQEWVDRFTSQWWKLEEIYAFYLYKNEETLTEWDRKLIVETVENLKDLLQVKIREEK